MNDDTIHINGKPATDAQLRKLTGLEGMEDALWQRNNHVTEKVARPVEVTVNPFFWSENDPKSDFPCWTDNDPDEWMNDNRSEAEAEWVAHIEA